MKRFSRSRILPKFIALVGLVLVLLTTSGCRRAPTTEPKYYSRELYQIKRNEAEALRLAALEKQKKSMLETYPMRDKICLPCRIKKVENSLDAELKYLNEAVHGKDNHKLKFRD